jgi:predicted acylesterase/phospholipase RssA
MRPTPASNVVGLALSGGGIRSAAFCLGALQALDVRGLIEKIDYVSSVSGGGYIGISMTAAMSTGMAGKFPFASELRTGEVPGVQHIRDHSNYLFPQGLLTSSVTLSSICAASWPTSSWCFPGSCWRPP